MIFLAEQLAQRKLADSPQPVLALSVHPGTVDTDFQKAWKESYGILGKVMEGLSRVLGKSAGEGAEGGHGHPGADAEPLGAGVEGVEEGGPDTPEPGRRFVACALASRSSDRPSGQGIYDLSML